MNSRTPLRKMPWAMPFLFTAVALATPLHGKERIGLIGEVHSGYFLGGASNGFWMEADMAKDNVSSSTTFKTYTLDGPTGQAPVKAKLVPGSEPCPETIRLDFASDDAHSKPVLAVSCPWNPAPRKVKIGDPTNKTYQKAAAVVLKAAGVTGMRVRVNQILRVDLDGDGEEEVIVSANTFPTAFPEKGGPKTGPVPPSAKDGFHSLVFVRRLVGDVVQTTVLVQEIARPKKGHAAMPVTNEVIAVLDLNGDGRLEVVTYGRYYEGNWFDIFDIEGLAAKKVLTVGCGA